MSGHQIFVDELARFARAAADTRWTAIVERVGAPLRVAVVGRRGVGRRTVARALARAGIDLAPSSSAADLDVYLIAEVVKPEDRDAIAAAGQRVLTVWNKADLADPLPGVSAEPMVGLLAVAALDGLLDDTRWAALRLLCARPADLSSPDSFLTGAHPLPVATRRRLLDTFDVFGITQAIAAIRRGESKTQVQALLRRLSRVDAVVASITAAGAEVQYRRLLDAVAELEALAVTDRLAGRFLSRDDTVIARMRAAIDVVEAAGVPVEPAGHPAAYLRRARHWQRYSRGPVSAVHRACGADIARGSLRLWSRAGAPPADRDAP
ncbi:hypothetical protein [Mycobacterium sp.]|uniref:hypothetical protein n=1 Tax=Mycobacterium sp. TaxID=1785 RepID=UPI001270F422|nr:hypothetical protein [Mycobacterium sp.]KAA8967516.1 MAG: hypothetical protein F6Q13_06070 [Mycobacterium sp.]